MSKFYLYFYGSLFLFVSVFSGCHYCVDSSESENLTVQLPVWPPSKTTDYPELSRWKITIDTPTDSFCFFTTASSFTFSFEKNYPSSILAEPITILSDGRETLYFHPSGVIYPYSDINNHSINLSWKDGFLAQCMHKIISSKKETGIYEEHLKTFLASFNWKKAQDVIDKKIYESKISSEKACFNPWLIDEVQLLENLCYGNFKSSFLNITGIFNLTLDEILPEQDFTPISSFIPENEVLKEKLTISLKKNQLYFLSNGNSMGVVILYKSAKNISKEYIHMPIFIEDI